MAPCLSSIRAERIRVAKLSASGLPLAGPTNGYVSDAQISVDVGLEIETGDEIIQKNGGGRLCATFKDVDRVKNATVSCDLCQLDAELLALTTGGTAIGDPPTGYMPPSGQASLENPVCFELWTRAWDGAAQAALPSDEPAYWHFVFPSVKFTPGNFTLDDQTHVFPITGTSQENNSITANGPFNDWPSDVEDVGGITRVYGVFLDGAPPAENCGGIAIPDQDVGPATGAAAGIPGTWSPGGADLPANVADLIAGTPVVVTASPTTAWTTGQYVQTATAGTGGRAHWNGTAWVAGAA